MSDQLGIHLQDCMVAAAIGSVDFLDAVRTALKPEYMSSTVSQEVLTLCYNYYDRYKAAPKDHFHDELILFLEKKNSETTNAYIDYATSVLMLDSVNEDYLLSCLNGFIRKRELQSAAISFAECVDKGEFTEAENLMYGALKSGIERMDEGIDYNNSRNYMDRADNDKPLILMPTGIKALDRLVTGYKRRQLICFMGKHKGGKSWFAIHTGAAAILHGLNVLHISHELTDIEVEERYDMMYGSLHSDCFEDMVVDYPVFNSSGVLTTEKITRPSILNPVAVSKVRQTVKRFGGKLRIKKYPMGTCNMDEIRRYMKYLETHCNFIPDVVINDYVDIMAPSPGFERKDLRHQINDLYIQHKRLADENNILVVTVSQANREGVDNMDKPTTTFFAEDIRKAANVDKSFAIWQSPEEERRGHASIHVLLNRQKGKGAGVCRITMCLTAGQFAIDSWIDGERSSGSFNATQIQNTGSFGQPRT